MPAPSVGSKSLAKLATMAISEVERKPTAVAPETKSAQEVPAAATPAWRHRFLSVGDATDTRIAAQPLPEPHRVATRADCAALRGLPADWARRPDGQTLDDCSRGVAWPGTLPLASVSSGRRVRSRWSAQRGLTNAEPDDLLRLMAADHCECNITSRRIARCASEAGAPNAPLRDRFMNRVSVLRLGNSLRRAPEARAGVDADRALRINPVNPIFFGCDHLADPTIRVAPTGGFFEPQRLQKDRQHLFDEQGAAETERYAGFPPDWAQSIEVSCSS